MSWFIEPFRYPFMQQALIAALLVSIICGSLGVYVVLRRMAFIGDALAHSALPGLVGAYLLHINLIIGAVLASVLTALGVGALSEREDIHEDSAIGILFTAMFAIGVLLMSMQKSYRDFAHMLFGDLLGVTPADQTFMLITACFCILLVAMLHKELLLTSCDPEYASCIGLRPRLIRYLLLVALGLAVVAGIQAVGVILTSAMLITPAASARLLTRRLTPMLFLSIGIAALSSLVGLYASYYASLPPGATIVVACTGFFLLSWTGRAIADRL
ncbi:MAG: ABC-type Mn2+/Zn2+ transport system permease subunit [Rhodothermales bacterium]|jgi:ABC-type Mn2+/Zn2+ transport system permease subunit